MAIIYSKNYKFVFPYNYLFPRYSLNNDCFDYRLNVD